jgi:hypothetical protein
MCTNNLTGGSTVPRRRRKEEEEEERKKEIPSNKLSFTQILQFRRSL